jgi:hypothetical protein
MRDERGGLVRKPDSLPGTCAIDLLVEFSRLVRGISPNVEHHEIVDLGLPQKMCCGDFPGFMLLDSATSQNCGARLGGSFAAVDEENFFVNKNRAVTK